MKALNVIFVSLLMALPLQARIDYDSLPERVRLYLAPAPSEDVQYVEVREQERKTHTGILRTQALPHVPTRVELTLRPTLAELHRRQSQAYWRGWSLDTAPSAWEQRH